MTTGFVARAALAATLLALAVGPIHAGASEPTDPWNRVPALPSGGYQADGLGERLAAAHEALAKDQARQEAINRELSDKVKNIDPMELASRQQRYMMDHPQEAMQLMQRNQQLGQEFGNAEAGDANEQLALDKEFEEIKARYGAALDRELAPVKARYEDLDRRAEKDAIQTEAGPMYAPWAVKEWNALVAQENASYEKVSAEWWSPSGPFQGWLRRYRDVLVKRIPRREEAENVGAGLMVQLVGTPEASFRPVATMAAVGEYMDKAAMVYRERRSEPLKPAESHDAAGPSRR